MTPQTTINQIEKDAEAKTEVKGNEIKAQFTPRSTNYIAFLDGYEDGLITGATEWAGKASGLVDTLKWIKMHCPIEAIVDDAISAALAKYKEVTNG